MTTLERVAEVPRARRDTTNSEVHTVRHTYATFDYSTEHHTCVLCSFALWQPRVAFRQAKALHVRAGAGQLFVGIGAESRQLM